MKAKFNARKTALHLLVWVAVFLIYIILIQGQGQGQGQSNSVPINWTKEFVFWGIYLFVFYINYLVLIPFFLKRWKWIPVYVVLAIGVLSGTYYGIRHTADRIAQKNALERWDKLQQFTEQNPDVKAAYEKKDREAERQREIRNRRAKEDQQANQPQNDGGRGTPPSGEGEFRGPRDGQSRPDRISLDSNITLADSLRLVERRRQQDSLLALEIVFTPKEEEYRELRRLSGVAAREARAFSWGGTTKWEQYNPSVPYNLSFVFALIFFYMASIVVFFAEQSGKSEKRNREVEKEKTGAELAYLKSQINPHFLFNTLNSIYSYTIGISDEASDAVLKLSSILRYMLYETNREQVPLVDELAVVDSYIALQRIRTTEKTDIEVIVKGDTRPHRIEPMLLIPIIENAFKYGVDSVEPSFVKIESEVEGNDFTFRVTNRIVRRNEGDKSNSGIGLKNIRRRLELIYGKGRYAMNVEEKNGIFSVTLHLILKD